MAITNAPNKKPEAVISDEKKIVAVIQKGGKPSDDMKLENDIIKQINIRLLGKEVNSILELRKFRPCRPTKKIPISLHDWIVEAIAEKIKRESEKYNIKV